MRYVFLNQVRKSTSLVICHQKNNKKCNNNKNKHLLKLLDRYARGEKASEKFILAYYGMLHLFWNLH